MATKAPWNQYPMMGKETLTPVGRQGWEWGMKFSNCILPIRLKRMPISFLFNCVFPKDPLVAWNFLNSSGLTLLQFWWCKNFIQARRQSHLNITHTNQFHKIGLHVLYFEENLACTQSCHALLGVTRLSARPHGSHTAPQLLGCDGASSLQDINQCLSAFL